MGAAVCLLAAALTQGVAPTAEAQPHARAAEARALFEQGRAAADGERWVEALDAFRRSHAIMERPSILFNIASTLIRLGRAREAIATIEALEALADPVRDARLLSDSAAIRRQALDSLRHVTLRVRPDDATVDVDGQVLEGSGAERSTTLDPGAHAVVVRAEGYEVARFTLEPGVDSRDVVLEPLDATLRVVPSVETATVLVDGTARGEGTVELVLPPGAHDLAINADGYVPFTRTLELRPGATLSVEASLELVPQDTSVLSSPLFWGFLGGGVAVLAGVAIALGVVFGTTTEQPYGGTSDTVIVPLLVGTWP